MDDIKTRQQVIDKIKKSTNILVTVSNDPTVDALSAALGLTLLLDKLEKHATAVFSGVIPPAISFLKPEKTFEHTTDSLRDFIIALDKEKADHLRYKVEGDVVKIFITPYKTTITPDDLKFDQGDYNVELVIALGVDNQEHLDSALDAHGKILHDSAVVTITAGEVTSKLGNVDWHDPKASGLSEMIADLAESLKTDDSLVDQQIATAILTGIVAQTDRFSNTKTNAKVMTTSANLMAAGADQQLIAAKLEESHQIEVEPPEPKKKSGHLKENEPTKVQKDGSLQIAHGETLEEMDKRVRGKEEKKSDSDSDGNEPQIGNVHSSEDAPLVDDEPSMGGTLNATSGQAAEDARHQKQNDQNKTLLSHRYLSPSDQPTMSGAEASDQPEESVDPLAQQSNPELHSAYALDSDPSATQPAQTDEPSADAAPSPQSSASDASADSQASPAPSPTPTSLGLPMPPPEVPSFSPQPAEPSSAYAPDPAPQPSDLTDVPAPTTPPERLGDILAPETPPAAPESPQPQIPPTDQSPAAPTPPPTPTPDTNDPGQFKIPGQ